MKYHSIIFFKKIISILFLIVIYYNFSYSQTPPACLNGGCNNTNNQYPSYTLDATSDWTPVGSVFTGGEYAVFNVAAGNTYQWSTCNKFGGYHSANTNYPYNKFDAELTLFDKNWNKLCFNRSSGIASCPNATFMGWTAPANYTGVVYVLVSDQYFSECQSTSTAYAVLVWQRSASGNNTCSGWSVSPSSETLTGASQSSSFDVGVTSGIGCQATFQNNNPSWITNINVNANGYTINYSVTQNNTGSQRTGTISFISNGSTVTTFTVKQNASNYITSNFNFYPPNYVNSPVYFYDASTGNPSPNQWTWDFGDGTSGSSSQDPQHTYTSTGSYTVSLTVKNSNNNSNTSSQSISIITPPPAIADFYSNKNNITPKTYVTFTDNSRNGPSSWKWTFYGGTPSTFSGQSPPDIQYNAPGIYRVKLTVSNNNPPSSTEEKIGYITVSPNGTNQLIPPPQNAINGQGHQYVYAEPIEVGTSTYIYKHKDFILPVVNGVINFSRFYNSLNSSLSGPLGYGWSHSYNYFIDNQQDTTWNVHYPDGHIASFIPLYNGGGQSFPLYSGTLDSLQKNSGGDFSLFTKDNHQYHFNLSGQLDKIIDLNGNTTNLNYSGSNLTNIVGQGGRRIALTYNSDNKITSVIDPMNRSCNFIYDVVGNLQIAKDAKANPTSFGYDINHRITTITNSLGDIFISNTYDGQGRITQQKDAYNNATTFAYNTPTAGDAIITNPDTSQIVVHHDSFYRKTYIKDELGYTNNYAYDGNSNDTSFTNENNITESRQFDWFGNITSKTITSNIATQFNYNKYNSPTQITDPKGNTTYITYDASNNPTAIHLPDNTNLYFAYNTDGTKSSYTDGRNSTTTYIYNNTGTIESSTSPNGIKYYSHDPAGRLIAITDENSHTTHFIYDDNDNIKIIRDALSQTIEFTYDDNNQLLSTTDKNGFKTTFTYDKKGRLKTRTNAKGGITTYTYNVRDNLTSITDPNNNIVSFTYDKKGRKVTTTNALGTTKYFYDGIGNIVKVTDATGNTINYTYTATNKVQSIKDDFNNSTILDYDKNDNLISAINALNKTTTYSYDAMNRLITVLDAANKTTRITYDENGNRKTISDPNEHIQYFNYDQANRLASYSDASGNTFSYGYDPVGNNTSITKPTGTISKSYDIINRVKNVTNSDGNTYAFNYDNSGNIISMSNNVGTTTMSYDSLNQLTEYTDPYNKTVSFAYDLAGNKTSIIYPGNNKVTYAYDNANNLKSVTDWLNHTFSYTYDAAGRNTQLLYPNGIHCDYGFDNANRLISKNNTTNTNSIINGSQFVLDAIGNRKEEQRQGPIPSYLLPSSNMYSYSNDDAMTTNAVWNYTNDASGNRTLETKGALQTTYNFSVDNLLNTITDTTGAITNFTYDPLGHRLSKSIGTSERRFVSDISNGLSQVLQITDGTGIIKSQYVYGLGLVERVDSANNVLYYHYDAQHNTVALSDQNGTIKDTYTYDPFGTQLNHTGTTNQPFTFLGEYGVEQENTQLYFVRARYYDALNGRFLSKDEFPIVLNNPQTINRYVYSTNNPVSIFDYSGFYGNQDYNNTGNVNFENIFHLNNKYSNYTDHWYYDVSVSSWKFSGELYSGIADALDAGEPFKAGLSNLGNFFKVGGDILGGIDDVSKVIKWYELGNKYENGQVSGLYIANEAFSDLYPKVAGAVGSAFGPAGKISAELVASLSVRAGQWLVNDTYYGNQFTDWLAKKLY